MFSFIFDFNYFSKYNIYQFCHCFQRTHLWFFFFDVLLVSYGQFYYLFFITFSHPLCLILFILLLVICYMHSIWTFLVIMLTTMNLILGFFILHSMYFWIFWIPCIFTSLVSDIFSLTFKYVLCNFRLSIKNLLLNFYTFVNFPFALLVSTPSIFQL